MLQKGISTAACFNATTFVSFFRDADDEELVRALRRNLKVRGVIGCVKGIMEQT